MFAPLQEGIDQEGVKNLIKKLSIDQSISYCQKVYVHENGSLHAPKDIFIVKMKDYVQYSLLEELLDKTKCRIKKTDHYNSSIYYISVNKNSIGDALSLANYFYETGLFEFSEPDFVRTIKPATNDPLYADQWNIENTGQYGGIVGADMDVVSAWGITTGRNDIKIAIIDDGVDLSHEDLSANLLTGYDAMGLGSNGGYQINNPHGTACAGIAAAVGNNNMGIIGVAHTSKIVPVRIYINTSGGWMTDDTKIADGINWAWQYGEADILSNSWFLDYYAAIIDVAVNNAVTYGRNGLGTIVLFATGNDDANMIKYPASIPEAIAVGAMSMCNERKGGISTSISCDGWDWGSNYGAGLSVVAPGVEIPTTDITGSSGYSSGNYHLRFKGTSSATPAVAGVMALILSANPCLTQTQARAILETTADKVGSYSYSVSAPNGSWNNEMGYGRVDAYEAVLTAFNSGSDLYLQNQTLNSTTTHYGKNVYAGENVTGSLPTGSLIIGASGDVKFQAKDAVLIMPGFITTTNSVFQAKALSTYSCNQYPNGRVSFSDSENDFTSSDDNTIEEFDVNGNNVTACPNPSMGKFRVDIPAGRTNVKIIINDMLGMKIYESIHSDTHEIDLSNREPGVYILKTDIDGDIKTQKIIIGK